ncbi:MAG TPA: LacI family DNA-binding transcriptional regulator, partial [Acidothermaceae bacterium]|nr:LacI family DNA-binding transcriptional regulator [Acidothermaceae bacterium]
MVDVAREANVALRTVSRFVNGDPTVGEQLAERVRQAIANLEYQPDERARQLRSGATGTIGAAVRNISDAHPVLRAVEEAARDVGMTVVAMSTEDDELRERDAVMSMCRRRMDGIIIEPIADNHQYLQPEIDAGLPVVAFDRPATGVVVDTVLSDNRGGIELAFKHLIERGHRRIAYIGDDERIYTGRQRATAFRACAKAHGSRIEGMVHPGPVEPARIAAALAQIRGTRWPATAIITGNAATTAHVIRQLG